MTTEAPPRPGAVIDSSDSEDDAPLVSRLPAKPSVAQNGNSTASLPPPATKPAAAKESDSDSDDDLPLAVRQKAPPPPKRTATLDDATELPSAPRPKPKPIAKPVAAVQMDSSDSEDDVPLAQRRPQSGASGKFSTTTFIVDKHRPLLYFTSHHIH